MKRKLLVFLVPVVFFLTACGGQETQSAQVTDTPEAAPTATVSLPTNTPVTEDTSQQVQTSFESECTLVSALPEPPEETIDIFSVQENDWVRGPKDAAVTLIEYGDFQ